MDRADGAGYELLGFGLIDDDFSDVLKVVRSGEPSVLLHGRLGHWFAVNLRQDSFWGVWSNRKAEVVGRVHMRCEDWFWRSLQAGVAGIGRLLRVEPQTQRLEEAFLPFHESEVVAAFRSVVSKSSLMERSSPQLLQALIQHPSHHVVLPIRRVAKTEYGKPQPCERVGRQRLGENEVPKSLHVLWRVALA